MTLETELVASTVLPAGAASRTLEAPAAGTAGPRLSGDAAEVFAAIAAALVPLAGVGYTVLLQREGEAAIRLDSKTGAPADGATLDIPIAPGAADHGRGYSGCLTLHLSDQHSAAESGLAGRLAVELAASILEREHLRSKAANLELALQSNREIGAAIGVVMMTYKCTSEQAFDRLRRASQQGHRKLAAVAQDVTRTGMLDDDAAATSSGSTT